ncbi:MAG: hypothetical protein HZB29_07810 [Nitrospinae bacterium]|nr:hypothetical protein [Nitrospinota bacterium]
MAKRALPLTLALAVLAVSCATAPPLMDIVTRDIESLAEARPRSFAGSGHIKVDAGEDSFSGTIALALEGDNYRLEALDAANRAVAAVAGGKETITRVDGNTGKKTIARGNFAKSIQIGGIVMPAGLLRTIVTGSPPPFEKMIQVARAGAGYKVTTSGPAMDLFVQGGRLAGVTIEGWDMGALSVDLGPMAGEGESRYVSGCVIKMKGGGKATIRWEKADFGKNFPAGFFTFDDIWDD